MRRLQLPPQLPPQRTRRRRWGHDCAPASAPAAARAASVHDDISVVDEPPPPQPEPPSPPPEYSVGGSAAELPPSPAAGENGGLREHGDRLLERGDELQRVPVADAVRGGEEAVSDEVLVGTEGEDDGFRGEAGVENSQGR
ncbi:unnamed protein product [Cuscuta epithymum]|uniref:Uncharacterized protein n=1 Tax=Cuscuta epithymum TaxID=186058 RepID=A0AAV0C781_9ASTE|nr:unnamed protein product [Cuscuta epithymum]